MYIHCIEDTRTDLGWDDVWVHDGGRREGFRHLLWEAKQSQLKPIYAAFVRGVFRAVLVEGQICAVQSVIEDTVV